MIYLHNLVRRMFVLVNINWELVAASRSKEEEVTKVVGEVTSWVEEEVTSWEKEVEEVTS